MDQDGKSRKTKLILFLGSGISRASGLPGVDEITGHLLNDKWHRHTDGRFFSGGAVSPGFKDPTELLQEFLRILKPAAKRCHPQDGRKGNYEDLYFLAEQIAEDGRGQVDNPAIHPFMRELTVQAKSLTDTLHQPIGWVANLACEFIRCVVEQKLVRPSKIEGLQLVEALARSPSIERLDIVTLNHDLLIELFLKQNELRYVDGFGEPEGDVRYFEPTRFEAVEKIRLFKLHGSVNWHRFRQKPGNPFSDQFGSVVGVDAQHAKNGQGKHLDNIDPIPWILAGTHTKATQYSFGIYAEMQFWFHRLLKGHNLIAMSGYGWGDRGINGRLIEWLHSTQNRRLVVMHQEFDQLISDSRGSLLFNHESLMQTGRIICIRKWMQDIRLDELAQHFI